MQGFVLISIYSLTVTKILEYISKGSTKAFSPAIPNYGNWGLITVVSAICLFELFRRVKLPYNKIINYFGKATFMVYLIHENVFFNSLWNKRNWLETLADSPLWFTFHLLKWGAFSFMAGVLACALYNLCMKALSSHKHLFFKSPKT